MTANLRASLAIFSVGFAIEGVGEFYAWVTGSTRLPTNGLFLFVGPIFTVFGLLFLFIGRHEWNEIHHQRVRHAHLAFGLSVLSFAGAALPIAWYGFYRPGSPPLWVASEFGAAVAGILLFSFVTYFLVVFHLVGRPGQGTLIAALAWSLGVSGFAGVVFAANIDTYLSIVRTGAGNVTALAGPLSGVLAYFFLSYFLLFAAYADAHRRVARGLETAETTVTPVTPTT